MHREHSISLVIPTHNEASGLQRVLHSVPAAVDEVVVVDWRSQDETVAIARACGARVIEEPRQGYGRAYLTGVPASRGEIVVTLDADGTYPADRILEIIDRLLDESLAFISAARLPLGDRASMNTVNLIGNRLLTTAANTLFAVQLSDLLSGMWVFKREVWSQLGLRCGDWNLSQEVKLRALRSLGAGFAEHWIPYAARVGESKLSAWRVGAENLRHLFQLRREIGPARRSAHARGPQRNA
ncbi:MAG: glycosyltransferase family 2 protein [Pseudomonadota bacterium]